jgi:DNA-binding NtrC family response regulator
MVAEDLFREDLYFRINTFEIFSPPLRDRKDDIPVLAEHMLRRYAGRRSGPVPELTEEAIEALVAHDWPGNVRELANAVERATILARGGPIRAEHLPTHGMSRRPSSPSPSIVPASSGGPHFSVPEGSPTLKDLELHYIQVVLEKHKGNKPAASKELGVSLKTLYNKINQMQRS